MTLQTTQESKFSEQCKNTFNTTTTSIYNFENVSAAAWQVRRGYLRDREWKGKGRNGWGGYVVMNGESVWWECVYKNRTAKSLLLNLLAGSPASLLSPFSVPPFHPHTHRHQSRAASLADLPGRHTFSTSSNYLLYSSVESIKIIFNFVW